MLRIPLANAGDIRDAGLIPGSERSPGRGHGNPLQYSFFFSLHYSCLENYMDRGASWATVHGVTKSQTPLKHLSMHARALPASVVHSLMLGITLFRTSTCTPPALRCFPASVSQSTDLSRSTGSIPAGQCAHPSHLLQICLSWHLY